MRSMTGYSKISYQNYDFNIGMEIKSVNNKNLNLKIKIPNTLNFLENKIRATVASRISRGILMDVFKIFEIPARINFSSSATTI